MIQLILATILGGLFGYGYYHFIGCYSGACPITSSPYLSVIVGSLLGLTLASGFGAF